LGEFETYFCRSSLDHLFDVETVFSRTQRPSEKVRDYVAVAVMQKLARRIPDLDDKFLQQTIMRGLLPQIKAYELIDWCHILQCAIYSTRIGS